jgi:hypothetical protein
LKPRLFVEFEEILGSLKISKEIVSDFPLEQGVDGGGSVTNMVPACHIDIVETSESNEQNPRVKKGTFVLLFNIVCGLLSCYQTQDLPANFRLRYT